MADTTIEWTDATWNPIAGCAAVSPGCTNCYAARMAHRLAAMGMEKYQGTTRVSGGRAVWTGRIVVDEKAIETPLSWSKPRMVFVNSMSDLFHVDVPFEVVSRIWSVMRRAPQHTFQILTKRPERMLECASNLPVLPNVWLGTSVEAGAQADRLAILRQVPAVVRFVSFEPLIARVPEPDLTDIHWAIVGGESGPRARPMDLAWVEEIHDAARHFQTAFFFKQWGGVRKKQNGRTLHGRTWSEMPIASLAAE